MARECKNRTKSKCVKGQTISLAEETRKQAEAQPAAPPEPVHPERKPKNNPKTRKNAGPRPTPPKPSSTPCAEPHPHPKAAPAGKSEDDSENLGTAVKQNADMLKEYGNAAFKREDFDEAIIGYNQAIKICPEEGVYYANRAAAYVKQQKYALAQSDCQRAISLQSNSPTAKVYTRLARCQYALGNVTAAQASLRQALELEPDNDMAKIFRAKALTLQGHIRDFEGARARGHWRMAQTACDSCICAIVDEGGVVPPEWKCWDIELLIARGEWDNAVVKIDSETADMSTKADMMLLHGLVLFLTGKLDEALERLAAALRFDPDSPKIKGLRVRVKNTRKLKDDGNIFFKDEEWLSAIEKYSEALEVIGEHADEGNGGRIRATLLSNRAATYVKIQRRKEAMADVKASLLLCPESYKALRTRGAINLLGENYDAAIDDFKQAIEAADTESARRTMESLLRQAETQAKKFRNKPKDHYETLGLSRGCTEAQIKKAYKQASLKHHPDKGGSEEKFKLIVEAYAILSDPIERRSYDAKSADNLYQSYDSDEGEDEYDPHFKFKERSNYSQNKYNGYWPWD
ncbi:TPR-like protein [Dentipellis sp. KUC8613]|nr:TPR-like protein [Dentipellis sp. KUC8613]